MLELPPNNSLAYFPQFDDGITKADLLPLIDEILWSMQESSPQIAELMKAKVPKATELAGLEINLAEILAESYNEKATEIIDRGVKEIQRKAAGKKLKQFTEEEVEEFMGFLGVPFKKLAIGKRKQIAAAIGAFYRFGRGAPVLGNVGFKPSFNLVDRRAMDFLQKDTIFWIGDHYDSGVRSAVNSIATNEMVLRGLGRREAGASLEKKIASYLSRGLLPPGVTVPEGWTGSTKDYFTGLVSNVRNKAVTWGKVRSYQEVGVETYEIVAVIDRRTSDICNFMNGKVFNVSWANETLDQVLEANNPEEVKDIIGWKRAPEAMAIAGVDNPTSTVSPKGMESLHKEGLDFPPYHFRCRTIVVASSQSEIIVT